MKKETPTSIKRGPGRPPLPPEMRKQPKPYVSQATGAPSGRKKGFKVTDETKIKQRDSYLGKFQIQTPLGLFDSIHLAAAAHNVSRSMIGYCCDMGERQRIDGKLRISESGMVPQDHTGYFKIKNTVGNGTSGRPVRTPKGDYLTIADAARAEGITSAGLILRLRKREDYHYLDENNKPAPSLPPIARDLEIIDLRKKK